MFDFVTKHKRLLQIILGLMIIPPFAFWGIQWTQRETAGTGEVASVGGQKISEQEFSEALRQQQDRMRSLLGRNFNAAMLDSPGMRAELLDLRNSGDTAGDKQEVVGYGAFAFYEKSA